MAWMSKVDAVGPYSLGDFMQQAWQSVLVDEQLTSLLEPAYLSKPPSPVRTHGPFLGHPSKILWGLSSQCSASCSQPHLHQRLMGCVQSAFAVFQCPLPSCPAPSLGRSLGMPAKLPPTLAVSFFLSHLEKNKHPIRVFGRLSKFHAISFQFFFRSYFTFYS